MLCDSSPAAQRGHRQALLTRSFGIRARTEGPMVAVVHQHSTSNVPAAAGAHSLAAPHSGQMGLGSGFGPGMVSPRGALSLREWRLFDARAALSPTGGASAADTSWDCSASEGETQPSRL